VTALYRTGNTMLVTHADDHGNGRHFCDQPLAASKLRKNLKQGDFITGIAALLRFAPGPVLASLRLSETLA